LQRYVTLLESSEISAFPSVEETNKGVKEKESFPIIVFIPLPIL
jgi:hypothetical protein